MLNGDDVFGKYEPACGACSVDNAGLRRIMIANVLCRYRYLVECRCPPDMMPIIRLMEDCKIDINSFVPDPDEAEYALVPRGRKDRAYPFLYRQACADYEHGLGTTARQKLLYLALHGFREACITLYHIVHPYWFEDSGGKCSFLFGRYE